MKRQLFSLFMTGVLVSCQPPDHHSGIRIEAVDNSPAVEYASLSLDQESASFRRGENQLNFLIQEYELGKPTLHKRADEWANSAKGQHIHLIVDGNDYMAHYKPQVALDLDTGKHDLVAFLSRSYHESLKNPEAYHAVRLKISETGASSLEEITEERLIYSRPKGSYTVDPDHPQPILLDFYLLNTNLIEMNRVKVWLDGESFILKEWKPHLIYGLKAGEHRIRLQLISVHGELIGSSENDSGIRKFNIQYQSK